MGRQLLDMPCDCPYCCVCVVRALQSAPKLSAAHIVDAHPAILQVQHKHTKGDFSSHMDMDMAV